MAAIAHETTLPLIPGVDVPVKVGQSGRGKGAGKVRLVPNTSNEDINLALGRALPHWNTILQKLIAGIYSEHSTGCLNEPPTPLTEESLKSWVENGMVFDDATLHELVEEDYALARSGKVSAAKALAEWEAANSAERNRLVNELMKANAEGRQVSADVANQIQELLVESEKLTITVEKEVTKKEKNKAARAAKQAASPVAKAA